MTAGAQIAGDGETWSKMGTWGKVLVRQRPVAAGQPSDVAKRKVARLEAHVRNTEGKPATLKDVREREYDEAVGGMRNPVAAVAKVPGLRNAGKTVKEAIDQHLLRHPRPSRGHAPVRRAGQRHGGR